FVSSAQRRPTVWELNDSCFRLYDQPDQLRYTDHQQFTRTNSSGAGRSSVCWRPQASTGDVEDSHPAAQTGFGLRLDLDGAPLLSRVDHGFGIGHEPSERHIAYDRLWFVAWRQSQSGGRRESGRADMHVAGCPTLFCFRSTQPDCGGRLISIAGVSKNFSADDRSVAALRSVHLEVNRGEFFVLLGPSGSGKTTLLRAVAGLEKPDQGEISLDGKVVYSRSQGLCALPEERQVGMVFQSYAIWPHLTVAENIGLVLTHGRFRLPKSEAQARIRHALSLVQLDDFESRPARLLSGGQQQRVALARALAVNPALLLMDEPLSNLDARLREEVRTNIKKLATRLGITALYVTHDQVEAMVLADRIAVMAHGEILQIGNPFELYRSPANSQIAEFFGSINWLHGKALADGRVDTEICPLVIAAPRQYEENVVIGIRPEDVKLVTTPAETENSLAGNVVASFFLGDHVRSEVKIGERVINVKSLPDDVRAAGGVTVHLSKERIVVFPEEESKQSFQPK